MTNTEKAWALIDWFNSVEFEVGCDLYLKIDFQMFVHYASKTLAEGAVMGNTWKAAYMKLYNLKKAIEDYENR